MSKFGKNIFKRVIPKFTMKKYAVYALGEITLLVVGILIALQINTWNENRKTDSALKQILYTIQSDLAQDTVAVNRMIYFFDIQDTLCDRFINKEVTLEYIENCQYCRNLVAMYLPFNPNKKGYKLLEKFSINHEKRDTVAEDLDRFYNQALPLITSSNEMLKEKVNNNVKSFEDQDWYVDYIRGKITAEMNDYFVNSEDYRKKVATYKLFAISNHLLILKQYKRSAKLILEELEERLGE
ncbi:MAG: DUF6090 family protein [Flavobacteriales bacterium]